MKNFNSGKWLGIVLSGVIIILMLCGVCVFVLDPYFHYRRPDNGLIYGIIVNDPDEERYVASGIIRNYDFDAVIAGTSMTECFRTSQFDRLFDVQSVKLSVSGGQFSEINAICRQALNRHPDMKILLRSLDLDRIDIDEDAVGYDISLDYLYNDNPIDDLNYVLNKDALLRGCGLNVIMATLKHREAFNFDDYANWSDSAEYGREVVLAGYARPNRGGEIIALDSEDADRIRLNIEQNVTSLAKEYPNTRFIYFMTPYSICYWDSLKQSGRLQKAIQEQEEVIELLLPCENIELYSFCDDFELVCDLGNYKNDGMHYSGEVNKRILEWIAKGEHRLTQDNYQAYIKSIATFYENYDYDSLFGT